MWSSWFVYSGYGNVILIYAVGILILFSIPVCVVVILEIRPINYTKLDKAFLFTPTLFLINDT